MKSYNSYKTINIDWLDKLPSQWKTIQIKQLKNGEDTVFIDGDWIESPVITDDGIRYLTTGNIGAGYYKEQGAGFINEETFEKLNCTEVIPGDLLISRLNEPIGRACIIPDLGYRIITAVDNVILRPKKPFNVRYLMHLMNSPEYSAYTSLISRGATMKRISRGLLGSIKIPFPSGEEQTQIASFLDYKTNLIDATIEKKKRLIELLKEKRQAVINEAVTKGLNPNAPMKDSGVEWLGEIPDHWEIKKMRYLCDITTGGKDTENKEEDGEYPFFVRSQTIERISTYSFDGEAILTAGDGVGVCKVWHYINGKFDFHQRVYMLSNFKEINGKYLFQYIRENFVHEVLKLSAKSTVDSLRRPMFLNFTVVVPPISEQLKIVELIEIKTSIIDNAIEKIDTAIEKLQTYRQSLISEAVTGKIDVRDWQRPKNT